MRTLSVALLLTTSAFAFSTKIENPIIGNSIAPVEAIQSQSSALQPEAVAAFAVAVLGIMRKKRFA